MQLTNRLRRLARMRLFDPATHGTYELGRQLIVGARQSVYDPETFATYDRSRERVVPIDPEDDGFWASGLEQFKPDAQAHLRAAPEAVVWDRYALVLSLLGPGRGVCLDACTGSPEARVISGVTGLGFEYQAIDIESNDERVKREDVTSLSLADDSVARIITVDTLEHVERYELALTEFSRVLEPGGLLFVHVPAYFFDRHASAPLDPQQDPWGHVRYFSARELVRNIAAAGLVPRRVQAHLDYGAALAVAGKPVSS